MRIVPQDCCIVPHSKTYKMHRVNSQINKHKHKQHTPQNIKLKTIHIQLSKHNETKNI